MRIVVDGWRAGISEWKEAHRIPSAELPPLSDDQKKVAQKLGIPEEDYARSAAAGRRTQDQLLRKTEKFAELLQRKLDLRGGGVKITVVKLNVLEHQYEVSATENGRVISLRVSEDMIDDLLANGSENLERNFERILDYGLPSHVA